jgi:hypothetical protein
MNSSTSPDKYPFTGRRKFIANSLLTAGALLTTPVITKAAGVHKPSEPYTVGEIMD